MKTACVYIAGMICGYYFAPLFNAIKKVFSNAYKEYKECGKVL